MNMADMGSIERYLEGQREEHLGALCEWLRIPSVSADPKQSQAMLQAADWVQDRFRRLGWKTEKMFTNHRCLEMVKQSNVAK